MSESIIGLNDPLERSQPMVILSSPKGMLPPSVFRDGHIAGGLFVFDPGAVQSGSAWRANLREANDGAISRGVAESIRRRALFRTHFRSRAGLEIVPSSTHGGKSRPSTSA